MTDRQAVWAGLSGATGSTDEGWRSYGPGKFNSIVDSYVYALMMDGWTSEETGDVQDFGWYGLVEFGLADIEKVAKEEGDELTAEEREELSTTVGAIVSENSQGFVGVDYYDDAAKMKKAWAAIEKEADEFYAEADESGAAYEVVVGNVGTVISTTDSEEAKEVFRDYVQRSKSGHGRAAGESVTLFAEGEIIKEHEGDAE